jgi:hypothetical protein
MLVPDDPAVIELLLERELRWRIPREQVPTSVGLRVSGSGGPRDLGTGRRQFSAPPVTRIAVALYFDDADGLHRAGMTENPTVIASVAAQLLRERSARVRPDARYRRFITPRGAG